MTETKTPAVGTIAWRDLTIQNADIPPQWLIYIIVQDVEVSAAECMRSGGVVVTHPRGLSGGRFCVIRDPAGAVCALFQPPPG